MHPKYTLSKKSLHRRKESRMTLRIWSEQRSEWRNEPFTEMRKPPRALGREMGEI